MDTGKVSALTLLGLSAVFDTIDHTILSRRLDDWFGISGKHSTSLNRIWLEDATGLSSKAGLTFGVSQRSVFDSLLFTLHTTPLSSLISGHAIPHHLYADDNQLHLSCASGDSTGALNGLQSCLASTHSLMRNILNLNTDKTEFLLIGNKRQWTI